MTVGRSADENSESERLAALRRLEVLDGEREPLFDDLVRLAALEFGAPLAAISLVDEDRLRLKATFGLEVGEAPRRHSLCDLAIQGPDVLIIMDPQHDPRVAEHPWIQSEPALRFYAGAPIEVWGRRIGTLCIGDFAPRADFSADSAARLRRLAASVSQALTQRAEARERDRQARLAEDRLKLLSLAEQLAGVGTWSWDAATKRSTWSAEIYRIHGRDPSEPPPDAQGVLAAYLPEDATLLRARFDAAIRQGIAYTQQGRLLRRDGQLRHVIAKAEPRVDADGRVSALHGTLQDVTDLKLADAALRESEARLRFLTEHMSDLVMRYDPDFNRLFVSESCRRYGYEPEELVGEPGWALNHPEDTPAMMALLDDLIAGRETGRDAHLEIRFRAKSGEWVWMDAAPNLIRDANGELAEIVWVMRDIRTRRRMEDELRQRQAEALAAERSAQMAAQMAGIGYWRLDLRTGERVWSPEVFEIHGVAPDSKPLTGSEALALYHPDDREGVLAATHHTRRTGEPLNITARFVRPLDGQTRYVHTQAEVERDAAGEVCSIFGVVRDVTEEVTARKQLEESEIRYRALAEHATDIIMRYDREGVIEYVSPSIRQLGYEPERLIGAISVDLVHPDDRGDRRRVHGRIVLGGKAPPRGQLNEFRVLTADGGVVWLQGNPSVICNEAGEAIGAVTVMRDVTARREMEEELRRRQAEAEAATLVKSEFLANMSHEIRTPLTAVTGFAGLLSAMDGLPPQARTFVDRINAGSQALLAIVNDILDFSRMEAGQIELNPQPFDPTDFVRQTVELVRNEAARKGLAIEVRATGPMPDQVIGDSGRLGQVLLNLLNNAVKFTDRGGLTITYGYGGGAGRSLRVEVADTGIGIAPEHSRRLFERFSQVDGSSTRQHGGSGLGLAISKGLIEMMGGQIGVESEPGRGSVFWFDAPAELSLAGPRQVQAEPPPTGLEALRVLLVDDVQVNRELVSAMLAPFGVALTEAANGAEAVEAARRQPFDVIVMDLQMPVMDGMAASRAIRAEPGPNRHTPILALSANVLPTHVEACRAAGMDDHVAKPINAAELLGKIAYWTEAEPGAAAELG